MLRNLGTLSQGSGEYLRVRVWDRAEGGAGVAYRVWRRRKIGN